LLTDKDPSAWSLAPLIMVLAAQGEVDDAVKWMSKMCNMTSEDTSGMLHAIVIQSFAQTRDLVSATQWFNQTTSTGFLPQQMSYDAMIEAAQEAGHAEEAVAWMNRLMEAGFEPSEKSYGEIMVAFSKARDFDSARRWFNRMRSVGQNLTFKYYELTFDAAVKAGDMSAASEWFKRMFSDGIQPKIETFTGMIKMFAEQGDTEMAVRWFDEMQACGHTPDLRACNVLLMAFNYAKDVGGVMKWFRKLEELGLTPDGYSVNFLLRTLAEDGQADAVALIFAELEATRPDVISQIAYNQVIKTLSKRADGRSAWQWIDRAIRAGQTPDVTAWNAVIARLLHDAPKDARQVLLSMKFEGVVADEITYKMFIRKAAEKSTEAAAAWYDGMVQRGIKSTGDSLRLVLRRAAKDRNPEDIQKFQTWWSRLKARAKHEDARAKHEAGMEQVVHLIEAYAKAGKAGEALAYLSKLREHGMSPGTKAYAALIGACRDGKSAMKLLDYISASGVKPDVDMYNQALRLAARDRDVASAKTIFGRMEASGLRLNQQAFSFLMLSHARAADLQGAELWLDQMLQAGFRPSFDDNAELVRSYALSTDANDTKMLNRHLHDMLKRPKSELPKRPAIAEVLKVAMQCFKKAHDRQSWAKWSEWMRRNGYKDLLLQEDAASQNEGRTSPEKDKASPGEDALPEEDKVKSAALVQRLTVLSEEGDTAGAVEIFEKLTDLRGIELTVDLHNAVLLSFVKNPAQEVQSMHSQALLWLEKRMLGVQPNEDSWAHIIRCCQQGQSKQAVDTFEKMVRSGQTPQKIHFDALQRVILNDLQHEEVQVDELDALLDRVQKSTKQTEFNELIPLFAKVRLQRAASLALRMKKQFNSPSSETVLMAMEECIRQRSSKQLLWWAQLDGKPLKALEQLASKAIRGCESGQSRVDSGMLDEIADSFTRFSPEDIDPAEVPYELVIKGFALDGRQDDAANWLDKMAHLNPAESEQ